jgi:uncharacterized protein (DUF433 family)
MIDGMILVQPYSSFATQSQRLNFCAILNSIGVLMTEISFDIQTVLKRLDALETELRQLRQTLSSADNIPLRKPTDHPYIESIPTILSGEPVIQNTRTPVRAIVERWKFGETPEEIARNLPHLRLAHIFDALGYYDDHQEEIEKYIALNRVPVND